MIIKFSFSFFSVFKPDELRQALFPTLEKLYRQDPESLPFRQPVDPQALGIPDYFEIVKKPMDLSTIKRKLDTGQYSDPWEYVDDVWLMFDNAWLYNRKTSRVYRYCTKVRNNYIRIFYSFINLLQNKNVTQITKFLFYELFFILYVSQNKFFSKFHLFFIFLDYFMQ